MLQLSYLCGFIALVIMYMASRMFTGSWSLLALAHGNNGQLSTSLFQNLIFTAMTVVAYVTIVAARLIATGTVTALPSIPVNLFILMGLTFATSATSKAITVSYLESGKLKPDDQSTMTRNRAGDTELTKVQMFIWSLITAAIYVIQFIQYVNTQSFLGDKNLALPDIDGALMALMGVSQGGYVAGKLVSQTMAKPSIEHMLPAFGKAGDTITLLGNFFCDSKEGNSIILKDATGFEYDVPSDKILEWVGTKVRFTVPDQLAAGAYTLTIRAAGQMSDGVSFEIK